MEWRNWLWWSKFGHISNSMWGCDFHSLCVCVCVCVCVVCVVCVCVCVCVCVVCVYSLYGVKQGSVSLSVVTVRFGTVFPRTCTGHDFYLWHPWDDRTDQDCILGAAVTIERRNSSVCCLIGQDYSRPTQFSKCRCTVDDFEW